MKIFIKKCGKCRRFAADGDWYSRCCPHKSNDGSGWAMCFGRVHHTEDHPEVEAAYLLIGSAALEVPAKDWWES
jgi:hypothetical protein